MATKTKLELTWVGKDSRPRLEPRILIEDDRFSYHASARRDGDEFNNVLVRGDNLLALKALQSRYAARVKCAFIDPPYNTGSAFKHYDDGVEHSLWLSLIRERVSIIKDTLSDDGSLWVTLDDNEFAYFKVMCDEVFGRSNFIACLVWQKKVSPANDALYFSGDHDYILVYAKNAAVWRPNRLLMTEAQIGNYTNPDNDARGPWNSTAYTCAKTAEERPNLYYPIENPNTGEKIWPKKTRVWAFGPDTHAQHLAGDLIYWGKDGRSSSPRFKKFLDKASRVVPRSVWTYEDVGHTQEARMEMLRLFPDDPFPTPKPERLIERILSCATVPGDLVLDSFAGSGTTGAVAHKMGRHWIMIELGDHAETHIVPRLKKVIDGKDPGGITDAVGWKGGGGYRYFKLAPSLLEKDQFDQWIISKSYNAEMLAEAMCKHFDFNYAPSTEHYWVHGHSSETDFIYVTTNSMTHEQLLAISNEVGSHRSLLICCKAFKGDNADNFQNLSIRKIPGAILDRCEWGKDDYSLKIDALPVVEDELESELDPQPELAPKRRSRQSSQQPMLFNGSEEDEA